jgi:serine/threonine-protein kinase
MVIEAGMMIRDYRIISLLGSGGMGEVWLAEDDNIQRKLAIKVLNPSLAADPGLVERFRQEARLQANLHHPGIVGIHSFFAHEDTYLLCMEYAEGISLIGSDLLESIEGNFRNNFKNPGWFNKKLKENLIGKIGPVPYERAVPIMLQILRTLQFIHAKDIIHRDIKPSNIMIDTEHNDAVKVMDFGIAKAMGSMFKTRTGTTMGSPFYMSPEQILHGNRLDLRTDIFSLGITFFEMLSGRLPYDVSTDSEYNIQKQIVETPLPNPRSYYPHIPDWVMPILFRMCEKDEARRWQNCTDIINAFEAGMHSGGSQPPVQPQPVARPTPSVIPATPAYSGAGYQRPAPAPIIQDSIPPQYPMPPKANNKGLWIGLGVGAGVLMLLVFILVAVFSNTASEGAPEEVAALEDTPQGKRSQGAWYGYPVAALIWVVPAQYSRMKSLSIGLA